MKYDFDTIISRRGTNSYKWDIPEEENVLPMWVADMDFRTAPAIIDALQKRVAHGIFGYTKVPEAYYDAVVRWFDDRHRWQVDSRWIIYTNGVVPALSLSKPWPCRVIKSSFRLLPIIVSTHLSVMTDASCLPIISFIKMAAT